MNIYTEDEALIELLEEGCTNDKRYKRLPKDVIKGYIKAYNHLKAATIYSESEVCIMND